MKNNKKLFTEATEELLEEDWGGGGSLFGGAPGGGGGSFSYLSRQGATSSQTGNKPWIPGSPPYRGMTGSPGGINTQDVAQESEAFAKTAGKNKPYPLEQTNEYLADAYIALSNAESQLHSCVKYNKILTTNPEKKALLKHCYDRVDALKKMIRDISEDFDRVTLS